MVYYILGLSFVILFLHFTLKNKTSESALVMPYTLPPALIINGKNDGSVDQSRYKYAKATCEHLGFDCNRTPAMFMNMQQYISECGDHTHEAKDKRYIRGCMFAHKLAMQKIADSGERHVIFEDDITLPQKGNLHKKLLKFLQKSANDDIAYIGHCYNTLCTHAIALTAKGAKKVLRLVDWCSDVPIDNQLHELCQNGHLTCSFAESQESIIDKILVFFKLKRREGFGEGLIWQKNHDDKGGGRVMNKKSF